MLEAIKRDPFNIKYVQNKLKDDLNLALIAIKKDIQSYIYLSKSLQENKVIKAYLPKQKKISTFIKPSKEERKGAIRGVSINFLLVSTELNDNYKYNIISPPKGMKIINKLRQGNGCLNNYTGDKGKSALYIQWEIPMDIEEGKIYKITVKGIDKEGYVEEISFPIEVPKTKPIQTKIINNELIVTDKAQTFTV
ncbi:hypothetical protein MNB_SV-13-1837 [hydrothermal vent metagenome]|uniref:DUF4116 domain-containing protein n=1 Tax=hydrothermal vent metagenome TaxID=652676 RepID=A0A1W1CYX8_9ZZZZ